MRALSLEPLRAMQIALGIKTIECQTWKTDYRGELLICALSKPSYSLTIKGHALCTVNLGEVSPFKEEYLDEAMMEIVPEGDTYAWFFDDVRWVEPFEVKDRIGLFDVDDALIHHDDETIPDYEWLQEHYEPLMRFGDNDVSKAEARKLWKEILGRMKEEEDQEAAAAEFIDEESPEEDASSPDGEPPRPEEEPPSRA